MSDKSTGASAAAAATPTATATATAAGGAHAMQFDENQANEMMDRYSRTIAELGVETMKSMGALDILVIGATGVGVETAKNLILGGPRGVAVWDDATVAVADLGVNFYLRPEHVGVVTRAAASLPQLSELNPYVNVTAPTGALTDAMLAKFGSIVVTHALPSAEMKRINAVARANGATFLVAINHGAFGHFFSDFGAKHTVTDADGEPVATVVVEKITRRADEADNALVVEVAATEHGFNEDTMITFTEVSGEGGIEKLNTMPSVRVKRMYAPMYMTLRGGVEANEAAGIEAVKPEFKVCSKALYDACEDKAKKRCRQVLVPNKFIINTDPLDGDDAAKKAAALPETATWTRGGIITEKKAQVAMEFRTFEETLQNPCHNWFAKMVGVRHPDQGAWESGRGTQCHLALQAVLAFVDAHNGALPALHSAADAKECVAHAQALNEKYAAAKAADADSAAAVEKVDETLVTQYALYARAELTGYAAFLGGVAAQEVVKKFGKYTPVHQWLHCDHAELLSPTVPSDALPANSRYDHQISIFGKAFQHKLSNQRWFLVGCGALGCEYLKGLALMGVGAGSKGEIHITDMDRIELSNLSRQFLFRSEHVGKPKSVCGSAVARIMNPDMNLVTHEMKVWEGSEDVFDDAFWDGLDGVWNALDNIHARKYTDRKCLFHGLPLLESGTQGTKANSEIILPFKTQSYNDNKDQETGGIAACTLRNFPHLIEHCIEWARPQFSELYEAAPRSYNTFLQTPTKFFELVDKESRASDQLELLRQVHAIHAVTTMAGGVTFKACLQLAFNDYTQQYRNRIKDLTHHFPEDARVTSDDGTDQGPFWSGHKRFPTPAPTTQVHEDGPGCNYLFHAANLYAFMYGVPQMEASKDGEMARFATMVSELVEVPWTPPSKGPDVDASGAEKKEDDNDADADAEAAEEAEVARLLAELKAADTSKVQPLTVADFEKDDDSNHHIDFVTSSSNLRARNYSVKEASRHKVKIIAGKIIAALATTTAMITGLVELEFYKLVLGLNLSREQTFRNANINMGVSSFNFFEPLPAIRNETDTAEEVALPSGFTSWDAITVNRGDLTVAEFLSAFPSFAHGATIGMLCKAGLTAEDVAAGKGETLYNTTRLNTTMERNMLKRSGLSEAMKSKFEQKLAEKEAFNQRQELTAKRKLSELYVEKYGPLISDTRNYLLLDGNFNSNDHRAVTLPTIKYVFRGAKKSGGSAAAAPAAEKK